MYSDLLWGQRKEHGICMALVQIQCKVYMLDVDPRSEAEGRQRRSVIPIPSPVNKGRKRALTVQNLAAGQR